MGENIATKTQPRNAAKYGVSRQDQDRFALRSQQLAEKAWREGRFAEEVVPVEITTRKGVETVGRDDHLRPETTLEITRLRLTLLLELRRRGERRGLATACIGGGQGIAAIVDDGVTESAPFVFLFRVVVLVRGRAAVFFVPSCFRDRLFRDFVFRGCALGQPVVFFVLSWPLVSWFRGDL